MPTASELRKIALSLPEAAERETWGHPTFRVRDKMFAAMSEDGRSASIKATRPAQAALIGSAPDVYFKPAYVGVHGWVGVNLALVDKQELRELVIEAWLMTAPKRLARSIADMLALSS
jgi:hypothetical protein